MEKARQATMKANTKARQVRFLTAQPRLRPEQRRAEKEPSPVPWRPFSDPWDLLNADPEAIKEVAENDPTSYSLGGGVSLLLRVLKDLRSLCSRKSSLALISLDPKMFNKQQVETIEKELKGVRIE